MNANDFFPFFFGSFSLLYCCLWIIGIGLSIAVTVFWIMMLIDVIRREDKEFKTNNEKLIWVLVIIFTHIIGALIYYFMVKRPLDQKRK